MFNQFLFIGRVAKTPQLVTTQNGAALTRFTLAVRRSFRNARGNYDTDFVQIACWNKLADRVADYCGTGSMVSVKGRVQMRELHITDDKQMMIPDIVADTVTFLKLNRNSSDVPEEAEAALQAAEAQASESRPEDSRPPEEEGAAR
ncbi:single-stranded DNA-binding protein [Alkalicoccus urumqiensis]|uniref:Single-stranded DNA-binding protein n=1 Tax=Alkalicoccus urumqiensis TaxID=1548213 RepID=A0A2P6MH71_ALKUR|nr:single-stranded DNA-binding protein [Alkalicoccus urumqiensis]PRO65618.1 single-stranded DNA-binding protein [Alkalicoccus urumqiensis]